MATETPLDVLLVEDSPTDVLLTEEALYGLEVRRRHTGLASEPPGPGAGLLFQDVRTESPAPADFAGSGGDMHSLRRDLAHPAVLACVIG